MKFQKLTRVAACAAAIIAAAGAAHAGATAIATISGNVLLGFHDLNNVSTGPYAGGESLNGTGSNHISFVPLPLNLAGVLYFTNAGTTAAATEITGSGLQTITQGGYTGTFTEIYHGPDQIVDAIPLIKNVTVLLSGIFDNGVLTGTNSYPTLVGISGTFDADVTSYSSSYGPFGVGSVDLNLVLSNGSTAWVLAPGNDIRTATTTASGTFFDPVPEPPAWSMMLLGVAGVGGAARLARRRAPVAA